MLAVPGDRRPSAGEATTRRGWECIDFSLGLSVPQPRRKYSGRVCGDDRGGRRRPSGEGFYYVAGLRRRPTGQFGSCETGIAGRRRVGTGGR